MVFWGYHFGAANGNEVREFSLSFSTDGGTTFPTSTVVGNPFGTFTIDSASTFNLGGTYQADTVRVNFTDNHFGGPAAGGDRLGVGEIKFIGDTVPEPGATLMAVLGGFGLTLRRRRA